MFAVIKTGGKQYRVAADQTIEVEKLAGEAGDAVTFGDVLMLGGEGDPKVGLPLLAGASVLGEIVEQKRDRKIIIFKKRRRQNSRRKNGHRQEFTLVKITDILTEPGKKRTAKKATASKVDETSATAEAAAAPHRAAAETAAEAADAAPAKKPPAKRAVKKPKAAPAKKPRAKRAEKKPKAAPKGSSK
jgi:large subunit ribosomal protein L21